ncbi:MAG: hypothetical protein Q9211_003518 [Gyalolechia sp. 1 TL-2023]
MADTRVNQRDNIIRLPNVDSEELSRIARFLKHNQWLVQHPQEQNWMRAEELALGYQLAVKYQVNDLKQHLIELFERLNLFSPFGKDWLLIADRVYGGAVQGDWKFRQYFRNKLYQVGRHQPTIFFENAAVVGGIVRRGGDLAVDVYDVQTAVWKGERGSIARAHKLPTYQEALAMDRVTEADALRGTGRAARV